MVLIDQQRTAAQFPACCSSAILSIGGKSLPRRSARLKIPLQAFGDKEYFAGAFASKICDKKDTPAPLCCSEVLGVVHAPSEVNASASYHAGVCPLSRTRHWNFGFCERFKHSLKVTPSRGRQSAGDVFPEREFGVLIVGCLLHFSDDPDSLQKETAPLPREAETLAGCHRKVLARGAKGDDVHGRQRVAVQSGDVANVFHVREVLFRHRDALRHDLAGPKRTNPIKRGGIGETPYAVKQGTERELALVQFFFPPFFPLLSNSIWNFARPSSSVVSRTSAL